MDEIFSIIKEIEAEEQTISEKRMANFRKLLFDFEKLITLDGGAVGYLNTMTPKTILSLYNIDLQRHFTKLEYENIPLTRANPEDRPWVPSDIKLVVLKQTEQNEKIAKFIIGEIMMALREILSHSDL